MIKLFKNKLRSALLLSSLVLVQQPATAQNLPGVAIDTATVAAEVQLLFDLAQQAFPGTIPSSAASSWRLYAGYVFKYYANTGIYVGIKDGQVYLLGGPYTAITPYGTSLAQVKAALEARIATINNPNPNPGTPLSDFNNVLYIKTMNDLAQNFSSITMEYGTNIGTTPLVAATVKLDLLGTETVDGVATTHMTAAIAGNGASQTYDLWFDSAGTFKRVRLGTFEYPAQTAAAIGPSIVSGFLIALSAMDNASVKAALSGALQSPALSTQVTKRLVGQTEVDTIKIEVGAGTQSSTTAYISDFGAYTLMTEFRSKLFTQETYLEFIDIKPR